MNAQPGFSTCALNRWKAVVRAYSGGGGSILLLLASKPIIVLRNSVAD